MIALAASTQGVVLPNIEAATSGLSSPGGTSVSSIPHTAPAARAKTSRLMRFTPDTSTIAGTITMSLTPT